MVQKHGASAFDIVESKLEKMRLDGVDDDYFRHWCWIARAVLEITRLDPRVADTAPTDGILTGYDEQHVVTYLRLLDAEKEGADWQEVAKLVLHIDPVSEPLRAKRAWETHLARARWMTENGYRYLLRGGAPH
jgi:hypothetical protein